MDQDIKPRNESTAPLLFSCRLNLFIVCLFASISFMFLRLNINFALVCMVKNVNIIGDHNLSVTTPTIIPVVASGFSSNDINNESSVPPNNPQFLTEVLRRIEDDAQLDNINETKVGQLSDYEISSLAPSPTEECVSVAPMEGNITVEFIEGEFEWSKEIQGAILGSFFYGFIFTQIPGGWISDKFGGKNAFISSIGVMSILSILSPLAAWQGPEYLFAVRLLQGLAHGATLPCINVLATRWSPPHERAFLLGIAYGGFSVAMAVIFPLSAFLFEQLGWEYIFYFTGGFGIIWCVVSYFIIYDWPEDHPRISKEELQLLQKSRTIQQGEKLRVPWRKIAFSLPVNIVHLTHFCLCWGFYVFVMYLPTFMKEVLRMSVSKNGLFSSFPYIAMFIFHLFAGKLFDSLRKTNFCSLLSLRKIFNTFGMVAPAIGMVMLGYLTCTGNIGEMLGVSICQAFVEFAMMGGYLFSVFDLAPRYAGILTGISNTFGNLPGFLCPAFVSYMTPNGSREEWLFVFYIAAGVNIFGAIMYLLFGKTDLQPWASPSLPFNNKIETEMKMLHEKLLSGKNNDERYK